MSRLLILRHVHAGDRDAYRGDDRHRPISARGRAQADALVATFATSPIVAVVSSPLTRCVQSVAPLAAALEVPVEEVDELAEGTPPDLVQRFLRGQQRRGRTLGGDVLACSHGDVIGDLIHVLRERDVALEPRPTWPKASTWVLDGSLAAALDGAPEALRAHLVPPPS